MIRAFDIMVDEKTLALDYLGTEYKRINITKKSEITFFTFKAAGAEQLVVVPHYLKQFREIEAVMEDIPSGKKLKTYMQLIKTKFDKKAKAEEFVDDEEREAVLITFHHKDIEAEFEYVDEHLELNQVFTIRKNNIFGENIVVDLREA